jgi:hypothetical protein
MWACHFVALFVEYFSPSLSLSLLSFLPSPPLSSLSPLSSSFLLFDITTLYDVCLNRIKELCGLTILTLTHAEKIFH